ATHRRHEYLPPAGAFIPAAELDFRRRLLRLSALGIVPVEFLSAHPDPPVAGTEDGRLGELRRPLERSRGYAGFAHDVDIRRRDDSARVAVWVSHRAGNERSVSRPGAFARRGSHSLGDPHGGFLPDVALHI